MKNEKKRIFSVALMLCAALIMFNTICVQAKAKELYTSLVQKSNEMYEYYVEIGMPVACKVKLNKNTIVINGSMSDYAETDKISKHAYKLSKGAKFVSRGGEGEDEKMSKKEFTSYLKEVGDSGLALVLEFKGNKVVCVAISS